MLLQIPGFDECLFTIVFILLCCLTITDIADEDNTNKALPITILVINSIIIMLLLLQLLQWKPAMNLIQGNRGIFLFILVLILSLILSIVDISDENKENKSLSVIVLIINVLIMLFTGYNMIKK